MIISSQASTAMMHQESFSIQAAEQTAKIWICCQRNVCIIWDRQHRQRENYQMRCALIESRDAVTNGLPETPESEEFNTEKFHECICIYTELSGSDYQVLESMQPPNRQVSTLYSKSECCKQRPFHKHTAKKQTNKKCAELPPVHEQRRLLSGTWSKPGGARIVYV